MGEDYFARNAESDLKEQVFLALRIRRDEATARFRNRKVAQSCATFGESSGYHISRISAMIVLTIVTATISTKAASSPVKIQFINALFYAVPQIFAERELVTSF
jgi:hypothetical protein